MRQTLLALVAVTALAAPAAAQTYSPSPESVGFRAYGVFDGTSAAASKSFTAVFGSSQVSGFGGGAEIDVWRNLFLRVAATRARRTGSRVFVDDTGQAFTLNIPPTVTMTPIEAGGGWRFASKSRVTPYVGAAFVSLGYEEASAFSQSGENVNERYTGGEGFGGVDVALGKGLFVGGEAQYRRIAVPLVSSSVMAPFREDGLGGFSARGLFGFCTG